MADKEKPTDELWEGGEDTPILSEKEIAAIKAEAKAKILAERKSAEKKKILEQETQRLKNEEGLVTGDSYKDEIVSITVDLAPFSPSININGRPYWHGRTYNVARHVADSLREQMYRTWQHQNEIDGKSLNEFYARKHVADLYKVKKGGTVIDRSAA